MKCLVCLKELTSERGLTVHIRIHDITVKQYYDNYLKTENEGKCLLCGKETRFYYLSNGYNRYCSLKCAALATTEQREETCLKKWGFRNPRSHPDITSQIKDTCLLKYGETTNLKCKETKDKIKFTCLTKYSFENPNQSKEVREKIKQTCKEKFGFDSWSKTPQGRELFRTTRSNILKNSNGKPFTGFIESDFFNILKQRFSHINIENQKSCIGYFLDFYFPDYNIVLEFDEEYHNLQYMKEKDKIRQNEIENYLKCSFVRIKKSDFLERPEYVFNQIESLLVFNPKRLFV